MSNKAFYQEIHEATVSNNFMIGLNRKRLTTALEKHIERSQGKLPHYGFSVEEFVSWIENYKPEWREFTQREYAMHMTDSVILHFMWSLTKGCFTPEHELTEHIIHSDPPKALPCAMLKQLPHWSQWIDAHFAVDENSEGNVVRTLQMTGFWATYCMIEGRLNMCLSGLGLYYHPANPNADIARVSCMFELEQDQPLDDTLINSVFIVGKLGNYGIREDHPDYKSVQAMVKLWARQAVNILIFVASQVDDIYKGGVKQIAPRRKGKHYRLSHVQQERHWSVGTAFLNPIREYEQSLSTMTTTQRRAAHIRRGHYHSFWRGPREGQRELFSKWLPPTVVRGTLED